MSSADHPLEADRLAFLKRIKILDSEREQIYDDFVTLAAAICEVPIAMISLVDRDRQWFKSRVGLESQESARESSFCTHTILGSDPMIVHDATLDERFANSELVTGELHFRFYAGVPVNVQGYQLGALCVVDTSPRTLTKAQEMALVVLARQLSQCLESRLEQMRVEDIAEKLEVTETTLELAKRRFEELFQNLAVACYTTDVEGTIFEFNRQAEQLFGFQAWEVFGQLDTDFFVLDEDKPNAINFRTRIFNGDSIVGEERKVISAGSREIWTLYSGKPLVGHSNEITGAINVYHDIEERKQFESDLAEVNVALESLASTDALTEIPNRRAISEFLEQQFTLQPQQISVILIDVDNFKAFNDTYGHPGGDEVLRTVANLISNSCRGQDKVGRYGGEEFIVVLPGADIVAAATVAERIRKVIDSHTWPFRPVTASLGVASANPGMKDSSQLVSLADVRLYSAKELGRNRVVASAVDHTSHVA